MISQKIGFRKLVLLGLVLLVIFGLCGNASANLFSSPFIRERVNELKDERRRISQAIRDGVSDEFSVEERRKMVEEIDARIENFRRDDRIYAQNIADDTLANENAQRVVEAREAREWLNNYNREWTEVAREYLNLNDAERANYLSQHGFTSEQKTELYRYVDQVKQDQAATQAENPQGFEQPDGNVSTEILRDSIEGLTELSSDLFNRVMEALKTGETASEIAHGGEITGDDPYDFSDDGSPASGSGQSEGTDLTGGDAGCDGTGPDCDGGEAETQQTGGSAQTEGTGQTGGTDQTGGSGQTAGTDQTSDNGGFDGSGPDNDGGESGTQDFDWSDYLIHPE